MGIGTWQLVIILIIVLLIFGGKRLANTMGDLGSGIRKFKKGLEGDETEKKEEAKQIDQKKEDVIEVRETSKSDEKDKDVSSK